MAIKVKLRKRKITSGRYSLYLDFYPAVENPRTGELTRREYLGMYIISNPKTISEKNGNKSTLELAEQIRQKWIYQLNRPEVYNIQEQEQLKLKEKAEMSFITYFKKLADERKHSNHDNWISCYNYLVSFTNGNLTFGDVTEKFCNEFRRYLLNSKSHRSEKSKLNQNSALSYFNKFKAAIKQAFREDFIRIDLSDKITTIKPLETKRNYLTLDELNMLAKCEIDNKVLRKAALFSALTGLRYSDIVNLTWNEVEVSNEEFSIHFKQQKTKGVEVLPISEQAFLLMGERKGLKDKVFQGLNDRDRYYFFPIWVAKAGITKQITFHCLRHTYATLQLSQGTDIYTVSKMLGHRELKTTQVYAKIIDQKKREAANKIKLNINIE